MPEEISPELWAKHMLETMSAPMRKRLIRKIAVDLRRRNAQRILSQQTPEGQKWQPRKRKKKGKRKMLTGLAKRKHLKTKVSDSTAQIGFSKSAARIAQIHHYGMLDNVSKNGVKISYPARPLLGMNQDDQDALDQALVDHFKGF